MSFKLLLLLLLDKFTISALDVLILSAVEYSMLIGQKVSMLFYGNAFTQICFKPLILMHHHFQIYIYFTWA